MKEIGVVSWKLPSRGMSCQRFREIFPPVKITTLTVLLQLWYEHLQAMDLFDMSEGFSSLHEGLCRVKCPTMVIGVKTDILFPIWQQRELAKLLQDTGKLTLLPIVHVVSEQGRMSRELMS